MRLTSKSAPGARLVLNEEAKRSCNEAQWKSTKGFLDVIKDVVFNNGNDIKNIKDEIRSSEERLLQNLKVHLSNVSSNLAEESPS